MGPTDVVMWKQSKANPNVSEQIITVTGELGILEKTASSWNGGWYESWNLLKGATALGWSAWVFREAAESVDNSESLSKKDRANILKALGLVPEMTEVTDTPRAERTKKTL
ncbi:hypothetical protein ACMFMG_010935 [Clarireedia jacksonii]